MPTLIADCSPGYVQALQLVQGSHMGHASCRDASALQAQPCEVGQPWQGGQTLVCDLGAGQLQV